MNIAIVFRLFLFSPGRMAVLVLLLIIFLLPVHWPLAKFPRDSAATLPACKSLVNSELSIKNHNPYCSYVRRQGPDKTNSADTPTRCQYFIQF